MRALLLVVLFITGLPCLALCLTFDKPKCVEPLAFSDMACTKENKPFSIRAYPLVDWNEHLINGFKLEFRTNVRRPTMEEELLLMELKDRK